MSSPTEARKAKKKLVKLLRRQPGIRGVGLGWTADGELCVLVNVAPEQLGRLHLPSEVDGVPVVVEVVGKIELHRRPASSG